MDTPTRELVRSRAGGRCEYCGIPQKAFNFPFQIEHIVAKQHLGSDEPSNLALTCDRCNLHKGPNLAAIDPESGNIVLLCNPRIDDWHAHFAARGAAVFGLTDIGRATVRLLNMNAPHRLELRAELGGDATPGAH